VKNADSPDQTLWSLWACKETAYKVIKKSLPDIVFAPSQWQVSVHHIKSEYAEGEVGIPGKDGVFIRLFAGADYIHCAGSDDKATLDNLIWSVEPLPDEGTCPSLFSRRCLAQSLAGRFSLDFHHIKIQRKKRNGELQPPCVYLGWQKTDIDVSLSHDGRFVAYSFSK